MRKKEIIEAVISVSDIAPHAAQDALFDIDNWTLFSSGVYGRFSQKAFVSKIRKDIERCNELSMRHKAAQFQAIINQLQP